jgi:hypothetical protein
VAIDLEVMTKQHIEISEERDKIWANKIMPRRENDSKDFSMYHNIGLRIKQHTIIVLFFGYKLSHISIQCIKGINEA